MNYGDYLTPEEWADINYPVYSQDECPYCDGDGYLEFDLEDGSGVFHRRCTHDPFYEEDE